MSVDKADATVIPGCSLAISYDLEDRYGLRAEFFTPEDRDFAIKAIEAVLGDGVLKNEHGTVSSAVEIAVAREYAPRYSGSTTRIVAAIRELRKHTGWGLKEAKDWVEANHTRLIGIARSLST